MKFSIVSSKAKQKKKKNIAKIQSNFSSEKLPTKALKVANYLIILRTYIIKQALTAYYLLSKWQLKLPLIIYHLTAQCKDTATPIHKVYIGRCRSSITRIHPLSVVITPSGWHFLIPML